MNKEYSMVRKEALMKGPLEALFCCIGDPVVGNPTQLMMEATFEAMNFPARYLTCTVDSSQVKEAIEGMKALQFSGGNVTAPHKVSVIPFLDDLSESARLSQAVNCIIVKEGRYIGDNTDGKGFLRAIEEIKSVEGMRVLVLGAGGAARAIITELALHKASSITIANRTLSHAQQIIDQIGSSVSTTLTAQPFVEPFTIDSGYDLVVQATSVGLFKPEERLDLIWEKQNNKEKTIAADVVFNPVETRFLIEAEQEGTIPVDGLGMLVFQGAIAVDQWTGQVADTVSMREALLEAFEL